MIYIKGVESKELKNILNFIYTGEVSLEESDLGSFLSVATDLKVKGLSQNKERLNIKSSQVISEEEKVLEESKCSDAHLENKVLPEIKKKRKTKPRKRKVNTQKLKTQTVTSQDELEKEEIKDEKNVFNTGKVGFDQVNNVENDDQHTKVNTKTDDEHGNTATDKDNKNIDYHVPIETPVECLEEPISTNEEMTTSFKIENIPIKQSFYAEPKITAFKCDHSEVQIPKEQMTIASTIIPAPTHKRKYPVLEKKQEIIPEKKRKDVSSIIIQSPNKTPKWRCYICATIFETKDASIIHLKEAHSISKSKSGKFINFINV